MALVFLWDPCGIIGLLFAYGSIIYVDYCLVVQVLMPIFGGSLWGCFHTLSFNVLIFMLTYSHLTAMFTDPGWIPLPNVAVDFSEARRSSGKRNGKTNDEWKICKHCEMFCPPRSHHCRVCKRCVRKMDHHCPWINGCVGELNQKYFILFLFYAGVSSLYALLITALTWTNKPLGYTTQENENRRLSIILLLVICAFSCVFVGSVLYDQLYAVCNDVTTIESASNCAVKSNKSKKQLMKEVCGRGHCLVWFLPCKFFHRTNDYRYNYEV